MAFGFPAHHTERYSSSTPETADLRKAVGETLNVLSWSLKEETHDRIIASTGLNVRSWGERVQINFSPDNSISVTSKCALPTQCLDWGKNKANVMKFMAEIREHV